MHVSEVMSARPVRVSVRATVREALAVSRASAVQHLVVVERDTPVGMVCVRCDLSEVAPESLICEHMTAPVMIGGYETLEAASREMCSRGIGALLVRGGEQGWGIATRGDLLYQGHLQPREEGLFFCAACGTHCHVHRVEGCEWVAFCEDCWERAGPPHFGEDLGIQD